MQKPKYTHLSQRNQILKRPGQHIGSTKNVVKPVWIAQTEYVDGNEIQKIVEQELNVNPGLIHIFYEVLSNAQDNYFRSKNTNNPLHKIEINVDIETGWISIWNDGMWIPTILHKWEKDEEIIDNKEHYEAEIIFGHLNSSSNYDDENTARTGGGLHGVGVKLTNIFSKEFQVETYDPDTGLKYTQTWSDNMSKVNEPKITKLKQKRGWTKVSYLADFTHFGIKGYTNDYLAILKKMAIDCAMITGQKIYFNDECIPVKDLVQYSKYYINNTNFIEFKSDNSTMVLCEKPSYEIGFSHVSFVNGIYTNKGGIHVEEWKKVIFKPLIEKLKTKFSPKGKNSNPIKLTPKNLEQYFMFFVSCNLNNPEFEGQTKSVLTSPAPQTNVPLTKLNSIMKWDFISDIEETLRVQGMKELKKTDGKKTIHVNIPKATDANKAGTVLSSECTLFLTEGDSAKAFATKGIGLFENGTDFYGAMPLRGKVLNVRGATAKQINENKEIANLKKILGLQHGMDYSIPENFKTLRYGRVIILTDADPDGDHIKGLLINFFQYFFPTLIGQKYISSLRTPIVKATIGSKIITFYYLKDFKDWALKQTQKFSVKYYKGLGTSSDAEIMEVFSDPRYIQFIEDSKVSDTVAMIFDKKRADDRKVWLENYVEKEFIYKDNNGTEQVPVSEFFNNEMIGFSIYDNKRSIPSVVDGLKPSQRKALWVGLKVLNTTKDYKVAQFAAEVAKQAEYHHGEQSMEQAIVGMAQTFVGSNNIAIFYESGQFGTREAGGKNAASSRYIFTRLASITRYIYRKEDDPILDYIEDEGKFIEPKYFAPIVPMLLINGSTGIGTGYSSNIPCYNPIDLVNWIKLWLEQSSLNDKLTGDYPVLIPWYWNFKGRITPETDNNNKFKVYGQVNEINTNCYEITELPIGIWTEDYNELLNTLRDGSSTTTTSTKTPQKSTYETMTVAMLKEELSNRSIPVSGTKNELITRLKANDKENGTSVKKATGTQLISKWEWYGNDYDINYKVWTKPGISVDYDNCKFKLTSTISTTNMTAFNPKGGMKKYEGVNDILHTFCKVRYEFYHKRKKHLIQVLNEQLKELESKSRFISVVLEDFTILKQTEEDLFYYFDVEEYWKKDNSFKYLTDMPVRSFTSDKYEKLLKDIENIKTEIEYIQKKSPKEMWLNELDEFVKAYEKWKIEIDSIHITGKKLKKLGKTIKKKN
jgi:DNA topoisomerase II